jgi:hypothetical protein
MALFGMTNPHTLGGGAMSAAVGANDRDFRPRNIHEMAFKLWPTSPTPFTYMTSKLPSRTTDDPEYKIFEWRLPVMTWTVGSVSTSSTVHEITLDATGIAAGDAYGVKVGDILEVEGTTQQYIVTTASADATTPGEDFKITEWNTTTDPAAADVLRWVGSAYEEGSLSPEPISRLHSVVYNFTQIFKDSAGVTGTTEATRFRPNKPWPQQKAECLERYLMKHETALLRGQRKEDLTGTHPKRTMGGLEYFISATYAKDWGGSMSLEDLEDQLQTLFQYGSKDKLFLCGNTAIKILNRVARNHAALNFDLTNNMNKDESFGLVVKEWVTPFGILRLVPHDLMSESSVYTKDGYCLDMKYVQRVKLRGRDTKWFPKAEENDRDGKKGYYMGELGFSLALPEVHQKWTDIAAYAPDA